MELNLIYIILICVVVAMLLYYVYLLGQESGRVKFRSHLIKEGYKKSKKDLAEYTRLGKIKILKHTEGFEDYYIKCERVPEIDVVKQEIKTPCGTRVKISYKDETEVQ